MARSKLWPGSFLALLLLSSSPAVAGDPPAHAAAMLAAAQNVAMRPAFAKGVGNPVVGGVPAQGMFQIPTNGVATCSLDHLGFGKGCAYMGINQEAINEPDDWHCSDPRQPPAINTINATAPPFQTNLADILATGNDKGTVVCNWSHFSSSPAGPSSLDAPTAYNITLAWAKEIPDQLEMNGAYYFHDPLLPYAPVLIACDTPTWERVYKRTANALHYLQDMQSEHHKEGNLLCSQDDELIPPAGSPIKKIQHSKACFDWLSAVELHATGSLAILRDNKCDESVLNTDANNPQYNSDMASVFSLCINGLTLACMGLERTLRHHCVIANPLDYAKTLVCAGPPDDHQTATTNMGYCEGEVYSGIGGQPFLPLATNVSDKDLTDAVMRWATVCKEPDDSCDQTQCTNWCKRTVDPAASPGAKFAGYCMNATPDAQCVLHSCQCLDVSKCGAMGAACCLSPAAPCNNDPTLECGAKTGTCVMKGTGTCGPASIVNGGFEMPTVPGYQLFATGSSFPGWLVVGASGNVAPLSSSYSESGFTFSAQAGSQSVDLTGLSSSATGVSQVVQTTPGTKYHLTFWIGNVVDSSGLFGSTSTVVVTVDGTTMPFTNSGGGGMTPSWVQYSFDFTASSAMTTIQFVNGDPSGDNSNLLDSVEIQ